MKKLLTQEIVDNFDPPLKGEVWIGDAQVKHFGLRAWAGKKGGNKAFAIRLRDKSGVLIRETYKPEEYSLYFLYAGWDKPLSFFLDDARKWACDRIAFHRDSLSHAQIESEIEASNLRYISSLTIVEIFEEKLDQFRKKFKNNNHADQLWSLIWQNIPIDILQSTLPKVDYEQLADCISNDGISYANFKILRTFVCKALRSKAQMYRPTYANIKIVRNRCIQNIEARTGPPYPEILNISDDDFEKLFELLDFEVNWRQALAIRLYFVTGAKMQQILKAKWSDIVDGYWYPFTPRQRKLWYESKEHIDEEVENVLKLIVSHHQTENISSPYLFPAIDAPQSKPIVTVQRLWRKMCGKMEWKNLPLSHVVLRYNARTNPSYSLDIFRKYYNSSKESRGRRAVSKIGKRRKNNLINASNYRSRRIVSKS